MGGYGPMDPASARARRRRSLRPGWLPAALARRFEAIVIGADGAGHARDRIAPPPELVDELCAAGLDLYLISATPVERLDGRLRVRPAGPGRLYLCVNAGAEVYRADGAARTNRPAPEADRPATDEDRPGVDADQRATHEDRPGVELVHRRTPSATEEAVLDRATRATVEALAAYGLPAVVTAPGVARRRIDLAREPGAGADAPAQADPAGPQSPEPGAGAELAGSQAPDAGPDTELADVQSRLWAAGLAGLPAAVELAHEAARRSGLADPRVSYDGAGLEIGLTDPGDGVRWALDDLRRRGIGPGLVLIVGYAFGPADGLPGADRALLVPEAERATTVSIGPIREPAAPQPAGVLVLGGGTRRLRALLADQLLRRRRGDVPQIDGDPAWTLVVEGFDAQSERVKESLLAIGDGRLGTRGAPLLAHPATDPGVRAAGVYSGSGPDSELAACPDWTALGGRLTTPDRLRRRLDLRTGVLRHEGPVTALALSSLARPGTVGLRARAVPVRLPASGRRVVPGPLTAALVDVRRDGRLDRLGGYGPDEPTALAALAAAEAAGFDRLLAEHRAAWARRWDRADVVIEGDPELQFAVRLALFHLMASVADEGAAAVGARGLSGRGYRGHVFWDSDVFVLPFLAATHPAAARAMLEYRVRRLDAARAVAARGGYRGARFPWESAADGLDVTPTLARMPTGEIMRIRTGESEEHVVADVAWAASFYLDWTGDAEFAAGPARELFVETARYWASRIRVDRTGRGHIYGVIGPDEYHEPVDDNAYTNVMARWNLRHAAALDGTGAAESGEAARWRQLADALVDGFNPISRLYEQFAGFFDLEPLLISDVAPGRPIAADLLLGSRRTKASQVVKQADVLMMHHLVPGEVAPDSLGANLDFYEPRTAHGSSLSPAIHASLLARAGRFREALAALRIAARIDLGDLTGTTASGIHIATMGGLWQALVFGFAGVRPRGDVLVVDPHLPPQWHGMRLRLCFRGVPFELRIDRRGVELDCTGALALTRRDRLWEVHTT